MSKRNDARRQNRDYARLLNHVCVGLGYCGSVVDGEPRHVDDFIPDEGTVTADQFAEWVLHAEGLDPATNSHKRAIRNAFIECMGTAVVNASELK